MKFAKLYQQTLEEEGIPQDWMESGIQYKALKKCINKVVEELKEIGLERETLQALLRYEEFENSTSNKPSSSSSSSDYSRTHRDRSPAPLSSAARRDRTQSPSVRSLSQHRLRNRSPSLTRGISPHPNTPAGRVLFEDLQQQQQSPASPVISYEFDGDMKNFVPKIVMAVETSTNLPVDAYLSSITIEKLRQMNSEKKMKNVLNSNNQQGVSKDCIDKSSEDCDKTGKKTRIMVLEREENTDVSNFSLNDDVTSYISSSLCTPVGTREDGGLNSDVYSIDDVFVDGDCGNTSDENEQEKSLETQQNKQSISSFSLISANGSSLSQQSSTNDSFLRQDTADVESVRTSVTTTSTASTTNTTVKTMSSTGSAGSVDSAKLSTTIGTNKEKESGKEKEEAEVSASSHYSSNSTTGGIEYAENNNQETGEGGQQPQYGSNVRIIEIHLESDSVFFHMLTTELMNLDNFKDEQELNLTKEINQLREAISSLVDPKARKTDMYTWREIFKEYMSSNVFFATRESDHGEHDVDTARKKLIHFAARILGFNNSAQLLEALGYNHQTGFLPVGTANNNNTTPLTAAGSEVGSQGTSSAQQKSLENLPPAMAARIAAARSGVNNVNHKDLLELERASTAKIESVLEKFFTPSSPMLIHTTTFGGSNNNNNNNHNGNDTHKSPKVHGNGSPPLNQQQQQIHHTHNQHSPPHHHHNYAINNNNHHNHNHHNSSLSMFLSRMKNRNSNVLVNQFRNKESYNAFRQFWFLNIALLRVLQFQSINRLAITKILKKFDKQTALDARVHFPSLIANDPFLSHSLAKNICFVITEKLLPVTPQIDDFLCPVCLSVAYKPIRLNCNHVFCVKCLIHLQRSYEDKCPMCRQNVVMNADEQNLDTDRMQFVKLYFPKETKIKQLEMEKQIVDEQMGHLKKSGECIIQ